MILMGTKSAAMEGTGLIKRGCRKTEEPDEFPVVGILVKGTSTIGQAGLNFTITLMSNRLILPDTYGK